jgi:hypothetical protein
MLAVRRLVLLVAFVSACEESEDGTSSTTIAPTSTATTTADPTDASTTTEAGSESEASTDAPLPGACEERSDCKLVDDCCTCEAMHVDADPPECDADCERTTCEDWGITEILCSHTCLIRLVECDPTLVECADAPPECDDGFAPSIEARCWTRHCVPMDLCVPY